jgi:hypothetical protein
LRHGTAAQRALAANAACNGGLTVKGLSDRQAEKLTGVRRSLIGVINRAGPATVEALEKGETTLAAIRAEAEKKSGPARTARYVRRKGAPAVIDALAQLPIAQVDDIVERIFVAFGDAAVTRALDRLTSPVVAEATAQPTAAE